MDGKQLRAIEERANRATPGPWEEVAESGEWWVTGPETGVHFVMATNASEGILQANVDFICAARTDVPALIAEIRELRAKLDAVPVSAIGYLMADITPADDGDTQRLYESRAAVLAWLDDEQDAANADAEMRAPTYNGGCW